MAPVNTSALTGQAPAIASLFDKLDNTAVVPVLFASEEALRIERDVICVRLQAAAEQALEHWLLAHSREPTRGRFEGYRLLALQRQGARSDPGFDACRASCRELIFYCNMSIVNSRNSPEHLRSAAMVCRDLLLFVSGKLQNSGLGGFGCAARPP